MACESKHTKYQPADEEFCCPACGAPAGNFCVDSSTSFDCELIHDEDSLVCFGRDGKRCPKEYCTSGKAFVARLVKEKGLVKCEHCKGKGFVQKK